MQHDSDLQPGKAANADDNLRDPVHPANELWPDHQRNEDETERQSSSLGESQDAHQPHDVLLHSSVGATHHFSRSQSDISIPARTSVAGTHNEMSTPIAPMMSTLATDEVAVSDTAAVDLNNFYQQQETWNESRQQLEMVLTAAYPTRSATTDSANTPSATPNTWGIANLNTQEHFGLSHQIPQLASLATNMTSPASGISLTGGAIAYPTISHGLQDEPQTPTAEQIQQYYLQLQQISQQQVHIQVTQLPAASIQQLPSVQQLQHFNLMLQQRQQQQQQQLLQNMAQQMTLEEILQRQHQLVQQLSIPPAQSAATFPPAQSPAFQPSTTESSRLAVTDLPQKPKKTRKKKAKDFPKQPLTAYNFYFRHQRAKLLGEDLPAEEDAPSSEASASQHRAKRRRSRQEPHRRISFADMGILIGKQWKALGDEDKTIYQAQAGRDQARYAAEKLRYLQTQNEKSGGDTDVKEGEGEGEAPPVDDDRKRPADERKDSNKRKDREE
jgi:hypothetical protein